MLTLSLLLLASISALIANGIAPVATLTLPVLLLFMGIAYRNVGIVSATVLNWALLMGIAYLQSEDSIAAPVDSFDTLFANAFASALILTLLAAIFGVFSANLENTLARTARIAAQTRATATVGQTFARILNMDELLTTAADLIRDRFAYYHVQIFMIGDSGEYADLVASTGEVGITLMAQGFRVPVGSRTVVGEVASHGTDVYVRDIQRSEYQHPEVLLNTRSELALPLNIGDTIIGVLDIQSARVHALTEEDIEAMRIVANQVSQAAQNARLFESQQRSLLQNRRLFLESETNLREIERLNRRLTAESWEDYMLERNVDQFSIRIQGETVENEVPTWTSTMKQAFERQRPVDQRRNGEHVLAVPITIRGQAIGAVEVKLDKHHNPGEARSVLQAITERMAVSLENARLFEQAHLAAEREQQINKVAAQLQGLTSVDDVMITVLNSLGNVLQADSGAIRLTGHNAPPAISTPQSPAVSDNSDS